MHNEFQSSIAIESQMNQSLQEVKCYPRVTMDRIWLMYACNRRELGLEGEGKDHIGDDAR